MFVDYLLPLLGSKLSQEHRSILVRQSFPTMCRSPFSDDVLLLNFLCGCGDDVAGPVLKIPAQNPYLKPAAAKPLRKIAEYSIGGLPTPSPATRRTIIRQMPNASPPTEPLSKPTPEISPNTNRTAKTAFWVNLKIP